MNADAVEPESDLAALRRELVELRGIVALLAEALGSMPTPAMELRGDPLPALGTGLLDTVGTRLIAAGGRGLTRFALGQLLPSRRQDMRRILVPLGAALAVLEGEAEFAPGGLLLAGPALRDRVERVAAAREQERERRREVDRLAYEAQRRAAGEVASVGGPTGERRRVVRPIRAA